MIVTSFQDPSLALESARNSIAWAVDPNGTEIRLPFNSLNDWIFDCTGTTTALPAPRVLPDKRGDVVGLDAVVSGLKRGCTEDRRKIRHVSYIQLIGQHLAISRRAAGKVMPDHVILYS